MLEVRQWKIYICNFLINMIVRSIKLAKRINIESVSNSV